LLACRQWNFDSGLSQEDLTRKLSEFNARVLQRRGVLSCPEGCVCTPKSFCNMTYLKTDDASVANCSTWYERTRHSTTGVWRSVKDPRFGAKGVRDDTKLKSRFDRACRLADQKSVYRTVSRTIPRLFRRRWTSEKKTAHSSSVLG